MILTLFILFESTKMHKADLTTRIMNEMVDKYPALTDVLMKESIDALLHKIIHTLSNGGSMEIRGFGRFYLRHYSQQKSRNPKTADNIILSPRFRLFFKAGKKLKLRLNASYR